MRLDESKIAQIDAKAADVLQEVFGDLTDINVPIDLIQVLKKYGVKIEFGNFPTNDISGAFDREEKKILISEDDNYERQAFTIAHELGHILLHKDKQREIFYRYESLNLEQEDGEEETEANWFAASLLMPESLVKKYWNLTKDRKVLADIFGVSNTAMYFRLKHLGLI